MPIHNGVEIWIEDSRQRKLNHQEVTISLLDGRTVTASIEMPRNELYTVHCLSPVSVFCDVFIIAASGLRKRGARFYLDKSHAVSGAISGSSADHTEGQFRVHGIRTPKRQQRQGKLGCLQAEIRRIGEIIKAEPVQASENNWGGEAPTEFSMIDDFVQPPWLLFHFDIRAKESTVVPASTAKHLKKNLPHDLFKSESSTINKGQSKASPAKGARLPDESGYGCSSESPDSKKRTREDDEGDEFVSAEEDPWKAHSDRLQQEYKKEEAEGQRLLQKLQEQLRAKKVRNIELRRLLGEKP